MAALGVWLSGSDPPGHNGDVMSESAIPYGGDDVVGVALDPQQAIEQGGIRLLIETATEKADALQETLQARPEYEAVIFHLQAALQALDEMGVAE